LDSTLLIKFRFIAKPGPKFSDFVFNVVKDRERKGGLSLPS
jgi:hypothetical protein